MRNWGRFLLHHINHAKFLSNMIDQPLMPVNKRLMLYHINMIHHIKTALKRSVWGVYATHYACLIILINSLKGDDVAGQYNQTGQWICDCIYKVLTDAWHGISKLSATAGTIIGQIKV